MLLSLFSFDANDPSFNLVKSGKIAIQNKAGLFGAYASGFLNDIFGVASFIWPAAFAALGLSYILPALAMHWWRWCGCLLLSACLMMLASSADFTVGDLSGGGMIGNSLYYNGKKYLSPAGSFIVWFFIFVIGLQLALNFSWINLFNRCQLFLRQKFVERKDRKQSPVREKPLFHKMPDLGGKLRKIDFASIFARLAQTAKKLPDLIAAAKTEKPKPQIELPHMPEPEDDAFALAEVIVDPGSGTESALPRETPRPAEAPRHEEKPRPAPPEKPLAPPIPQPLPVEPDMPAEEEEEAEPVPQAEAMEEAIPLPATSLLNEPARKNEISAQDLQNKGQTLMGCFNTFDIRGELVRITPGPVVTMYEMRPAPGTRISKIANLSDELSMALHAMAVRIQAPIPGSDTVGIEIPNDEREIVSFRELAESDAFNQDAGALTMILGKDIAGRPYMADLAKMPHLLVAGSTGAGKSVCLNTIIISFLYRLQPEDMQLILIDPKRVEMSVYADLPHLVHPVVTDMFDAKNAFDWAVHEMERRFEAIKTLKVRNLAAYNQKLPTVDRSQPQYAALEHFPYLVIIVDEFADLMMTAPRDVAASIQRLGQVGRAAGVHIILATQRPSADVVTGLIKTNMGGRISFKVTSNNDSRIILDQGGAEQLLGNGDMLYKQTGGALKRLQGPYLSDEEVQRVVLHWKNFRGPSYKVDFSNWNADKKQAAAKAEDASDALYEEARAFIMEQGRASISLLQRRFKIGFNRSARLMEQFESEGLIGSADGSKPRTVIR